MKKILLLVMLLLVGIEVYAQEPQNYVIIDQPTNVRAYPIGWRNYLGVVDRGILTVTGRNFEDSLICTGIWQHDREMWLQVDYYGLQGWVKLCAVDFEGDIRTVPISMPQEVSYGSTCYASVGQLDQLGDKPENLYIVAKTRVLAINVRESPSLGSEVLDLLKGEQVYAVGRTQDSIWVNIRYSAILPQCGWHYYGANRINLEGWVAAFLLDLPDGWQDVIPVVES